MSLIPVLMNLADELSEFDRDPLLDDDFGLGIYPHEFHRSRKIPRLHFLSLPSSATSRRRHCPYSLCRKPLEKPSKLGEDFTIGKDGFQACINAKQFKPNELTVKTVDDKVIVEGKHEEREDEYGLITRHFLRKYTLPKGYDPNEVVSTLSSDGILTVKAPPPHKPLEANERIVQIQHTGPAHLSVKENPPKEPQPQPQAPAAAVENGDKSAEKMED